MQIPILSGIYTDNAPDYRTSYPRNMIPVPKEQGVSAGYLKAADGIVPFGVGVGIDRGGINWNGVCYRAMGTKLVKILADGATVTIGEIGGVNRVTFDYSFDYLAIASNLNLFYYDGESLTQVTDADLGLVIDVVWVDGYFMTTDGTSLVVTDLNNPNAVNPLKYGSSEINPDDVKGLLKLRNEIYALNRYTIEVFSNVGSTGFPFQRINGAVIPKGTVGTHTACVFMETIAFMGNALGETIAVHLGSNASAVKISTREIDKIIEGYTEEQLKLCKLETRTYQSHAHLLVHLPDLTLVYDANASSVLNQPVWFTLSSGIVGNERYRGQNLVYCYNKWLCGDTDSVNHGYLDDTIGTHYGDVTGWEFGTIITYNEGRGILFHELELVCLTGRVSLGDDPVVWTQYSKDGLTWSQEKAKRAGKQGDRTARLNWLSQGYTPNIRMQKFRGTSDCHIAVSRLEARIEALNV